MKRVLAGVLSVLAVLAMLAPDAFAQAPTAKVTITGLVDNITSYTRNLSIVDLNVGRPTDTEWYARTRARPDITAEVGTTKFVLGLEIDATWGQTGGADSTVSGGFPQRFGTSGGWDLNTDLVGTLELKWAYTEFGIPGIPFGTRVRLGAQPWAATYKTAVLATGDFAGVHTTVTATPIIKFNATYAQVEEDSTGSRDGFVRGNDYAFIGSVEVTPFKGLDIRPIYALFRADGTTSGGARGGRGGVANAADAGAATIVLPTSGFLAGFQETRHTIGVDARWRMGPFSLEPTAFYQFGERDLFNRVYGRGEQERSAWFFDLRGGFQTGPLLLEAAAIYTTGNRAQDDIRNPAIDINFYEPISTDSSYYATWAEHFALNIDYFNQLHYLAGGLVNGASIGYDKYGLARLGGRASYAVTPAFTLRAATVANWTAHSVDHSMRKVAGTGMTPTTRTDWRGDSAFLGLEIDLGFQWRFAPGVALDVVGAHSWMGEAMGAAHAVNVNTGVIRAQKDTDGVQSVTARVRYTF